MTPATTGRLAENVAMFVRLLRAAGLPLGPAKTLDAVAVAAAVGLDARDDFRWALKAVCVDRPERAALFDQAFDLFWRNPRLMERLMAALTPGVRPPEAQKGKPLARRLAEALAPPGSGPEPAPREPGIELDMALTYSERAALAAKDFEQMSTAEAAAAKRAMARLRLPVELVATRRRRPHPTGGRLDLRATLRAARRTGGEPIRIARARRVLRPPPVVVLCDVSGSMERYARMLLHFMHAAQQSRTRVASFVFGTELTNITRALRRRDVDDALAEAGRQAGGWAGGTRIGAALEAFNQRWGRRVLAQGPVVLLITDGLDRAGGEGLAHAAERLARSCRRLVWLNPLLRWEGFEPRAAGARALTAHVDELRPAHNLNSLEDLVAALARPEPPGAMERWRRMLR